MIAIFSLLGLVLFGGGLYAIYDGWPYLVLERGFTEVIIGSIAATGGLIMLSLAWVLKQIKTLRTELAEAAEARASTPAPIEVVTPAVSAVPRETGSVGEAPASWPVGAAAVGAGAIGIGAAAIAVTAAEKSEPAHADSDMLGRDLFGALVADQLVPPEEDKEHRDEPLEPARDEAVADMFDTEMVETVAEAPDHTVAGDEESHDPAEIVAARTHAADQHEAPVRRDEEAEPAAPDVDSDEVHFEHDAIDTEEQPSAKGSAERDEFAALRESLTNQLGGLHRPAGRIEPSLASEEDPFAEAEAWIVPSNERREPSFDAPPVAFEAAKEPPVPVWPPRTGPQDIAAAEPEEPEPLHEGAAHEESLNDAADEAAPVGEAERDEPEEAQDDELTEAAAPAAPQPAAQEPAASEEGIVGAYQVGETHFTIYADGSIRARTPDGEYSFASMDELKVYLASEKSRLGA